MRAAPRAVVELPPDLRPVSAIQTLRAVESAREAAAETWPSAAISIGSIHNPCERRHWLALRWFKPPKSYDAKTLRRFDRGNVEEARVVAELREAGFTVEDLDPSNDRQWKAVIGGGWLRGKVDGLVLGLPEAPKQWHILEIKTMGAAPWARAVKLGAAQTFPEHYAQAQLYMAALGYESALYWAVNRETDEIHAERWKIDQGLVDKLLARAEYVTRAPDMPPQIASSAKNPACRFCPFTDVCHAEPEARAWPERNCRTCVHFEMRQPYRGHCSRWTQSKDLDAQKVGCPAHVTEPTMIPAEQVDAASDGSWIEYRLADGSIWRDAEAPDAKPYRKLIDPSDPPF